MTATPSEPAGTEVRRLHPLSPFFNLILLGRQFLVPLVVLLVANRGDGSQFFPAIPLGLGSLVGFVQWLRFTYTFDGVRLVIDEGVLTRKQRIIPLDRIQQVEVLTKLRHRLFGVTVLRVDTAGGGGSAEVNLSVVSVAEAARLRAVLLPEVPSAALLTDDATSAEPLSPRRPLVRLGVGQLAVGGMTGSELAIMLTILFWLVQLIDDLPDGAIENLFDHVTAPSSAGGFLLGFGALVAVWFGLAAAAGVIKNFGFTMSRSGDDLRVVRGLLDRREGSMPAHRLQAVRVQQTVVRRMLGLAEVVLQSGGQATSSTSGVSRIDVPILTADRVDALLGEVLPAPPPQLSSYVPAPAVARRRSILRRLVPAAFLAVGLVVGFEARPAAVAFAVALLVLAAASGELAFRGLAHAWDHELLVARAGGLARETVIVPAAKAQSTRLTTTPFQRRAGLGTLLVDVAGKGRTPQVKDGDLGRLRELQAAVLLASPAARRDEDLVRRRRVASEGRPGVS
ncbi:MAG: PH domain-containing protein [Actinomycetota bacterium]|nr:PH domain-containing protein [Actinomycetota bacterium]